MFRWKRLIRAEYERGVVEDDLTPYRELLDAIKESGKRIARAGDFQLREISGDLREKAQLGCPPDDLLVDAFALVREVAARTLSVRPFDVQVMAGIALHQGKLVEMRTGEGKTLAAVFPAFLNALTGQGVHILTFNDYLARRDAEWMGSAYRFMGLSVGVIQENLGVQIRKAAYRADVTYATAKEAGFDFLRMYLCRDPGDIVHRGFHFAIVDEADSILIDEARVPLVVAGPLHTSDADPYRIAEIVETLREGEHWESSENGRNVFLTERGVDLVESELACGDLHEERNFLLLTEVNQALHAQVLLKRDVDYIVRDDHIEIVDEFTGRVVDDRRWPDGLQAALEAKEGLTLSPGGRILGTITLQHFLKKYDRLSGMTGTARTAAAEFDYFYGFPVVPIPTNRPYIRKDLPDLIFSRKEAKVDAIMAEIRREHDRGRPVLVGTSSVEESEDLARRLFTSGIDCQVLNARNDEREAEVVAGAGALGSITISTSMAGRGTDIRLGGVDERSRVQVVALGGLHVIGTNRHESRRIDEQLRGRAGRQGDPGSTQFFLSLEDDLMMRFGINDLIPKSVRATLWNEPIDIPLVRREVDRVQRIVEGQNYEIRKTTFRYADFIERQRMKLQDWRMKVLKEEMDLEMCRARLPEYYLELSNGFGEEVVRTAERSITLHHIDQCWADYLDLVAEIREGIHLVGIGGLDPLFEFQKQSAAAFSKMLQSIEDRVVETFLTVEFTPEGLDLEKAGILGPSSTWTYRVSDRVLSELQQMLFGHGSSAFAAGAALMTWPLLAAWGLWQWLKKRSRRNQKTL